MARKTYEIVDYEDVQGLRGAEFRDLVLHRAKIAAALSKLKAAKETDDANIVKYLTASGVNSVRVEEARVTLTEPGLRESIDSKLLPVVLLQSGLKPAVVEQIIKKVTRQTAVARSVRITVKDSQEEEL